MYLRKGDLIRHNRNMDICYEIIKVHGPFSKDNKYKIKTNIINMCFVESYPMNYQWALTIYEKDFKDWNLCTEPNRRCVRKAKWITL